MRFDDLGHFGDKENVRLSSMELATVYGDITLPEGE